MDSVGRIGKEDPRTFNPWVVGSIPTGPTNFDQYLSSKFMSCGTEIS